MIGLLCIIFIAVVLLQQNTARKNHKDFTNFKLAINPEMQGDTIVKSELMQTERHAKNRCCSTGFNTNGKWNGLTSIARCAGLRSSCYHCQRFLLLASSPLARWSFLELLELHNLPCTFLLGLMKLLITVFCYRDRRTILCLLSSPT